VVICQQQGADLHMAQLMPLPLTLTVSCFSKIQIGFTFLVVPKTLNARAHVCFFSAGSGTRAYQELLLLQPFSGVFSGTTWVSRYQKGNTSLDLSEARDDGVLGWQWHQLDHTRTVCTSVRTDNHISTSSLNFYRPDALPDAQPTVSKH